MTDRLTPLRFMPLAHLGDHLLPDDTPTIGVMIRCGCHRMPQVRNVHVPEEAIQFMRSVPVPPDLIMLSYRCPGRCKQKVKVTARMLYFAA